MKCAGKWFEEVPKNVRTSEDSDETVWRDKSVMTAKQLKFADLVVINNISKKCQIIDFSVR